ncbi:carbonic anhydrase family protein [Candidatus Sororendozoicomonas aggregata]|uniref:carbonic anhydrase n=1 Tax=Candidatus Sororendozoicomonas aggregata TaxID=3073239 RepID=UPI002ED04241
MIKKSAKLTTAIAIVLSVQGCARLGESWSYSGKSGPDYWGELTPSFSTCKTGSNQSPIDITRAIEGNLPALKIAYKVGGEKVINNGHTIGVNYEKGSTITVGDRTFELKQFHFHAPSENTIEGKPFPMEAHFVHADKRGNLAVVAVMYNEGMFNAELEKVWAQMPEQANTKVTLKQPVNADKLIPANHDYYRFNGSLTTPPCSEGVNWFVVKAYDTASKEQIAKFSRAIGHDNNRPVQPVNGRVIVK